MAFEFIHKALDARSQAGLLRSRQCVESSVGTLIEIDGHHYLNFSGNDYLGMRQSIDVMQAWVEGISLYGVGSGASPLVTGYTKAHRQLEEYLADGLKREAVMLFNCGYSANLAICQALLDKNRLALADKLMHASFIDGALSSEATLKRFKHNDTEHLRTLLADAPKDTLVATEGVFSMDGDKGAVKEILQQLNPAQHMLMLDDAHGFGVLGQSGMGTTESLGLSQQEVPILMGTFGKAVGTAGAFVAGSQALIDYLVNFAKHYVYSTAMPPAQAVATLNSLKAIRDTERREILSSKIFLFKDLCSHSGIQLMPSSSAIQPVLVGDPVRCVQLSEKLKSLGVWVNAMRAPTVPKGTDRLRVTLSADHSDEDISALVDALQLALDWQRKGELHG